MKCPKLQDNCCACERTSYRGVPEDECLCLRTSCEEVDDGTCIVYKEITSKVRFRKCLDSKTCTYQRCNGNENFELICVKHPKISAKGWCQYAQDCEPILPVETVSSVFTGRKLIIRKKFKGEPEPVKSVWERRK